MIKFSSVSKMDVHRFCTQTHFLNARDTTITKNGGSILVCNKCANNFRIGNFKKWFELEDQNENVRSFGKLKDATFNKEGWEYLFQWTTDGSAIAIKTFLK